MSSGVTTKWQPVTDNMVFMKTSNSPGTPLLSPISEIPHSRIHYHHNNNNNHGREGPPMHSKNAQTPATKNEIEPGDNHSRTTTATASVSQWALQLGPWVGWVLLFCSISFFSGMIVSVYLFQGTCDDIHSAATWNIIAAWRAMHAASMNPLMALISPQTSGAAGAAAASVLTLTVGAVGLGLQRDGSNPLRTLQNCADHGAMMLNRPTSTQPPPLRAQASSPAQEHRYYRTPPSRKVRLERQNNHSSEIEKYHPHSEEKATYAHMYNRRPSYHQYSRSAPETRVVMLPPIPTSKFLQEEGPEFSEYRDRFRGILCG